MLASGDGSCPRKTLIDYPTLRHRSEEELEFPVNLCKIFIKHLREEYVSVIITLFCLLALIIPSTYSPLGGKRFLQSLLTKKLQSNGSEMTAESLLQIRMGNGEEFLEESPYKSLEDLWDGEQ